MRNRKENREAPGYQTPDSFERQHRGMLAIAAKLGNDCVVPPLPPAPEGWERWEHRGTKGGLSGGMAVYLVDSEGTSTWSMTNVTEIPEGVLWYEAICPSVEFSKGYNRAIEDMATLLRHSGPKDHPSPFGKVIPVSQAYREAVRGYLRGFKKAVP